jgi:hypothetical protein
VGSTTGAVVGTGVGIGVGDADSEASGEGDAVTDAESVSLVPPAHPESATSTKQSIKPITFLQFFIPCPNLVLIIIYHVPPMQKQLKPMKPSFLRYCLL